MKEIKKERTLVLIKPDGVQRNLIGEIIKRYERIGLKLVALKMLIPTKKMVESHYLIEPTWKKTVGEKSIESYIKKGVKPPSTDPLKIGERVLNGLKKYMTSGPVIAMIWQGAHAVPIVRKLTGKTEPLSSDAGSIRGDYVLDSYQMSDTDERAIRNLMHSSGTNEEAEKEIKIWFKKEEILEYRHIQEQILYDVNLDGLLE